jgi:hypothetical protein
MVMESRSITGLVALTALGVALLPGTAFAQQKSIKDQLVGTWTLTSWERISPNGTKSQSYGANAKGIAQFDANGRMFVMYARPNLPKIASNNPETATPEEAKAVMTGLIAYFGTFSVDDAKAIAFTIEASTFPNQVGSVQKRTITSLTAGELKYETAALNGDKISQAFRRGK